ncbi:unnamed protein product [Ixodes persulcatus]
MSAAAAPGGRRLPATAAAAAVRGGEQRGDQHVEREPGPAEPPGGLVQLAVGLGRGPEPRGAVRPAHHGPGLLLRQAGIRDVSVGSQTQGAPADAVAGTQSRARLHRPALPGAGRPLRRLILPLQKNESGHLSGSTGPPCFGALPPEPPLPMLQRLRVLSTQREQGNNNKKRGRPLFNAATFLVSLFDPVPPPSPLQPFAVVA